jgi:hypothetical protein
MFKYNKKDLDKPTTGRDLRELADGMAEIFATKGEFKDYIDKAFKTFATKEDVRSIVEASEKRIIASNNKTVKSNDEVAHEVKTMREEQSAHSGNHKDIVDTAQNHERRIKQLEAHANI